LFRSNLIHSTSMLGTGGAGSNEWEIGCSGRARE
jgi:hypothetical protein